MGVGSEHFRLSFPHSTQLYYYDMKYCKPNLSGSHWLHYNITFTVITSRTDKTGHWSTSQLYSWTM